MRAKLKPIRFQTVAILTAPLILLLLLHGYITIRNFHTTATRYPQWYSIKHFAREALYRPIVDLWVVKQVTLRINAGRREVQNIFIEVSATDLDSLEEALPESGERRIPALINGIPARLSLRGSTRLHWLGHPKSFRVRTRKKVLFRDRRDVVLSVKQVLGQHGVYRLGRAFGLLAPDSDVVNVFINNKFYAVEQMIERIDDVMLIRRGRMPGKIFKGENFPFSKDSFPGVSPWLYRNPYVWTVVGGEDLEQHPEMVELVQGLSQTGSGLIEELEKMVSTHEMAAFLALQLLANDFHVDNWHNQRLYLDPLDGLFHPIVWDTSLLSLQFNSSNGNPIPSASYKATYLVTQLMRNPHFMASVMGVLNQHINEKDTIVQEAAYLSKLSEEHQKALYLSRDKSNEQVDFGELLLANAEKWKPFLDDARVSWSEHEGEHGVKLLLRTEGHVGVRVLGLVLNQGDILSEPSLWLDMNMDGQRDDADKGWPAVSTRSADGRTEIRFKDPITLLPGYQFEGEPRAMGSGIKAERLVYPLGIEGAPGGVAEVLVESIYPGRTALCEKRVEKLTELPSTFSKHPWAIQQPVKKDSVLSGGVVEVRETLIIPQGSTLVVEAGTTVKMDPGVSIISRGVLDVRGTEENPVHFQSSSDELPFGVVALQGPGADGSTLRYAHFSRGSIATVDRVRYSGMLSVHYASGVTIEHCSFGRNFVGDDQIRCGASQVTVKQCVFKDARGDAVDYDYTSGSIEGCTFSSIGNDAIDLMTCSPLIRDNHIVGAGDKGVSVGNDSHPILLNNTIKQCAIGVETKDESFPLIVNNLLENNGVGVNGYKKNWRYGGGGKGQAHHTVFRGNAVTVSMEKDAEFYLYDCDLEPDAELSGQVVVTEASSPGGIYTMLGVKTSKPQAGAGLNYTLAAPGTPSKVTFQDNFASVNDGWESLDGLKGLRKDGRALRIEKAGTVCKLRYALTDVGISEHMMLEMKADVPGDWRVRLLGDEEELLMQVDFQVGKNFKSTYLPLEKVQPHWIELESKGPPSTAWLRQLTFVGAP